MDHRGTTLEEALRKSLAQEHAGRHRRHAMEQGRSVDLEVFPPRPTSHKQTLISPFRAAAEVVIAGYNWPSPTDKILGVRYLRCIGGTVTLRSLGLLERVKTHAENVALGRFRTQIWQRARRIGNGTFEHSFNQRYHFGKVLFSLGRARLSGRFRGIAEQRPHGRQRVKGRASIEFYDQYVDPLSIEQRIRERAKIDIALPDVSGRPFDIVDQWTIDIDIDR
ncbi:MAG: hypothetical protein AAGC70_08090 [Pseudomonadota bacterium]